MAIAQGARGRDAPAGPNIRAIPIMPVPRSGSCREHPVQGGIGGIRA